MEFAQLCQRFRASPPSVKFTQLNSQQMHLTMQQFDGLEGRLRTMARKTVGIQPGAETALVQLKRRWCFMLALEVVFHGRNPCAVLDAGKK